jgi:hypothetical protein
MGSLGVGSFSVIVEISGNQIGKVGREGGDVAVLGRAKETLRERSVESFEIVPISG